MMLLTKLKIATAVLVGLVALVAAGASPSGSDRRGAAPSSSEGDRGLKAGPAATHAAAAGQKVLSPQEEMKRLEGIWAITTMAADGGYLTAKETAKHYEGIGSVTIKGDQITFKLRRMANSRTATMRFWVDPARSPGNIALVDAEDKADQGHLKIALGIYELKGDTLKICYGADRPDKYETKEGDAREIFVLKWAFPLKSP